MSPRFALLRNLFRRRRVEHDLDEELQSSYELLVEQNRAAGLPEDEAQRQARLELGSTESLKDAIRDVRSGAWLEQGWQDARYALRTLRRSPGFTAVALLTLTLGIGANTAIFQMVNAVMLRSLPVRNPEELALLQIRGGITSFGSGVWEGPDMLSWHLFTGVRDHQQAFADVFAWTSYTLPVGTAPDTRPLRVIFVSGRFFRTLGIAPAAGRLFDSGSDPTSCAGPPVVLSYRLWQSEFAAQTSAVGRRIVIRDHAYEIAGVASQAFHGMDVGNSFDLALPFCALGTAMDQERSNFERSDVFWLNVAGRLKPGWTRAQASAQLRSLSPALFGATVPSGYSREVNDRYRRLTLEAQPGARGVSELREEYRTALMLLLGITALILLIASANLANLMLARSSSRRREFAVRIALGGSRLRLLSQALSEGVWLTAAGTAGGLILSMILSRVLLVTLAGSEGQYDLELSPDLPTFAFTSATALFCCLVFSLVPALYTLRRDPGSALKSAGRGLTADRNRFSLQRLLVVVQVSTSMILIAGALLLVLTFRNLVTTNPGFRTRGILIVSFDLARTGMSGTQAKAVVHSLVEEMRSIPQIEAAAATSQVIVNGGSWTLGLAGGKEGSSKFTWVSPGHFETLEMPLIAGHDFTEADTENGPKVAIVNETFAKRYFPKQNPVGRTFRSAAEPGYPAAEYLIVGICKDTRYQDLREPPPPQTYAPISQHPSYAPGALLYVRSAAPLKIVRDEIKRRVAQQHPGFGVSFTPFEADIRGTLAREQILAILSGFFGVLAGLLATIGLYGVVAYMAAGRRNEIGIRMALGSTPRAIVGLFLTEAALITAIGVVVGLIGSLAFAHAARSLLFGIQAFDARLYLAAVAILSSVAAIGSYLPARRASRLDPISALHHQ